MARYSAEHKARSRAAIVNSAGRLFRKHGYRGVGIDDLCAAAGLTRGTFYAHFKSKADLFDAVMGGRHGFVARLSSRTAKTPAALRKAGARVARDYLQAANRSEVLGGCSLATLAMDTVRADAPARAAYAQAVQQVIDEFQRGAQGNSADSQQRAQAAIALCVGGLLISGACGDHMLGEQVARSARKVVSELLADR